MKKSAVILLVIAFLLAGTAVLIVVHQKATAFRYEDHLDEPVVTIDDTTVSLREFGYYIYEVEAFVQKQALIYDPDNPKKWWNTHFSASLDSTFVCDYAKKVAINTLICDEIYYREARGHGVSLNEEAQDQAAEEAAQIYNRMDSRQKAVTGLSETVILKMKSKQALASAYAEHLANTADLAMYGSDPHSALNWDGRYYRDVILPAHTVQQNEELLDQIKMGQVTVNN